MYEGKVGVWNETVEMGPNCMYFNKDTSWKCTSKSFDFPYIWTNQGWTNQIKMCTDSTEKERTSKHGEFGF